MAELKTVAIANLDGSDYIVINEADYDAKVHTLWHGPELGRKPPDAEPESSTEQRAVELADTKTVPELKAIAKEMGITGYSTMKQAELAGAIAQAGG